MNKNRWRQAIVLVAGVLFNFLFAWLIYFAIMCIGGTVPISAFTSYDHICRIIGLSSWTPRVLISAVKAGLGIGDILQSLIQSGASLVRIL